jgi:hypothetical protein
MKISPIFIPSLINGSRRSRYAVGNSPFLALGVSSKAMGDFEGDCKFLGVSLFAEMGISFILYSSAVEGNYPR